MFRNAGSVAHFGVSQADSQKRLMVFAPAKAIERLWFAGPASAWFPVFGTWHSRLVGAMEPNGTEEQRLSQAGRLCYFHGKKSL